MPASMAEVRFESVSKRFYRGRRHTALRDLVPAIGRSLLGTARRNREAFWALKDVSFSVGRGETLGVIGPNGSGKSTVLRLLAGILRADEGHVLVTGPQGRRTRIGAVIELSAGFHYELAGRENIYLQGAVLGMRRDEIARRFEEIVDFAELSEFIDTPVKHYSSGMIARLGFAIAAHLDPDILVMDEVLAVGDDAFQRKAFARMAATVRGDIPAIIVSHQLHRITELCNKAILLTHGRVIAAGSPSQCVEAYVSGMGAFDAAGTAAIRLDAISVAEPPSVEPGERVKLRLEGEIVGDGIIGNVNIGIRVRVLPTEDLVFTAARDGRELGLPANGKFEIEVDVRMNVPPGSYRAQSVVWTSADGSELTRGPSTIIGVGGTTIGGGRIFVDPHFRLLAQ
ncbi:MAG TPA: ABC transporter ATP-binding protein [Gemmatimonadaceae bacterium]|nr:ABC transporter ATP-binding protein [Gemmatimonadaceae bacterium]